LRHSCTWSKAVASPLPESLDTRAARLVTALTYTSADGSAYAGGATSGSTQSNEPLTTPNAGPNTVDISLLHHRRKLRKAAARRRQVRLRRTT
jgi:hypothetical protein